MKQKKPFQRVRIPTAKGTQAMKDRSRYDRKHLPDPQQDWDKENESLDIKGFWDIEAFSF